MGQGTERPPVAPEKATTAQMSVEDWATESLLAAREAYQDPTTGMRIKAGAKLSEQILLQELAGRTSPAI